VGWRERKTKERQEIKMYPGGIPSLRSGHVSVAIATETNYIIIQEILPMLPSEILQKNCEFFLTAT